MINFEDNADINDRSNAGNQTASSNYQSGTSGSSSSSKSDVSQTAKSQSPSKQSPGSGQWNEEKSSDSMNKNKSDKR